MCACMFVCRCVYVRMRVYVRAHTYMRAHVRTNARTRARITSSHGDTAEARLSPDLSIKILERCSETRNPILDGSRRGES